MAWKYYLMYSFGYWEMGEYGFEVFDTLEEAREMVKTFLSSGRISNIDEQITLVQGREYKLKPTKVVEDVEITGVD